MPYVEDIELTESQSYIHAKMNSSTNSKIFQKNSGMKRSRTMGLRNKTADTAT